MLTISRLTISLALASCVAFAQQQERVDLNVIHKIKVAEFGTPGGGGGRGAAPRKVPIMETMYNLTDRYGPRLTNSPQFRAAGDWAVKQLKEWELSNVHLEKWATPADNPIPSWQLTEYDGAMVSPTYMSIIGVPVAWTAGTNSVLTGDAILAEIQTPADLDKWHGKLRGKIVLTSAPPELPFPIGPLATRYTPEELAELATELIPGAGGGRGGRGGPGAALQNMTPEERQAFQNRQRTYFKEEGALVTLQASARGESGTLFGGGAPCRMDTTNLPQVSITAENYNRIARLLEHGTPVRLSFNIKTQFDTSNTDSFNVIAEIPGSSKPDDVVMVGGISIPGITGPAPPTTLPAVLSPWK